MRPVAGLLAVVVLALGACSSDDDGGTRATTVESVPSELSTNPSPTTVAAVPSSNDLRRTLPEGDEPEVLGPLGQADVAIEADDGSVQIGSATVPAAVDGGFPLPDDLEVQIASQDGDVAGFSGVSALTFEELVDFYATELPAAGYEVEPGQFVDGVVAVYDFTGVGGTGQLAISSAPGGGRSVLVTFTAG